MPFDAVAHLDEGMRRLAHLARAARLEVGRWWPSLAEALGGKGKAQDGLDLIAQEQDRHGEEHERGAKHPHQEDMRVRRVGLATSGKHMHDGVVELDANVDEIGTANGVEPERAPELASQFVGERRVEQIEERLEAGLRQAPS